MLNTPGMGALPPQLMQLMQLGQQTGYGSRLAPQQQQPKHFGSGFNAAQIDASNAAGVNMPKSLMDFAGAGGGLMGPGSGTNMMDFAGALGQQMGVDFQTDRTLNPWDQGSLDKMGAAVQQFGSGLGAEQQGALKGHFDNFMKAYTATGQPQQGLVMPQLQFGQQQPNTDGGPQGFQPMQQPQSTQMQVPGMPPVRMLAGGGPLDPFGINIVGDAGPEAIVGGQVIPLQPAQMQGQPQTAQTGFPQRQQPSTQVSQGGAPSRPGATQQQPQQGQQPQGGMGGGAFGQTAQNVLGGNFGQFGFGAPQMPQQVGDWLSAQLGGNIDYAMKNIMSSFPSVFNSASPQLAGDIVGRMVADAGAQTSQAALQAIGLDTDRNRAVTERGLGVANFGQGMTSLGLQEQLGFGGLAQQQQQLDQNAGFQQQQQQMQMWLQTFIPMLMAMLQQGTPTAPTPVVGA